MSGEAGVTGDAGFTGDELYPILMKLDSVDRLDPKPM